MGIPGQYDSNPGLTLGRFGIWLARPRDAPSLTSGKLTRPKASALIPPLVL